MSSHQRPDTPGTRINVSPAAWPVTCNSAPVAHEAEHRVNETRDLDPHARLRKHTRVLNTCALTKLSRTEDKSRVWSCIPVSNLIQLPASDRRRQLAQCRCVGN